MDENPYEAPQSSVEAGGWSRVLVVIVLLAIGAAYFGVVVPMVLRGQLDRALAIAPALLAVVCLLVFLFDPNQRAERRYNQQLKERGPADDEELLEAYFSPEEVDRDIPGQVRAILAKHMAYPREKMLPDDDLLFFWYDLDAVDLMIEIEERFGIKINDTDAEQTALTIRDISRLVHRLRSRNVMSQQP
jgi:acyl carrier protein